MVVPNFFVQGGSKDSAKKVFNKIVRKCMAKTPSIRKEGMAMANAVAKVLPPKAQKTWKDTVKKAVATGYKVYHYGKRTLKAIDTGLEAIGVVRANDWIRENLWEPFVDAAGQTAMAALGAAGTLMGSIFLRNTNEPMYAHPIGPPNYNENIMGINFNHHY